MMQCGIRTPASCTYKDGHPDGQRSLLYLLCFTKLTRPSNPTDLTMDLYLSNTQSNMMFSHSTMVVFQLSKEKKINRKANRI